jgi:hypothetical protein
MVNGQEPIPVPGVRCPFWLAASGAYSVLLFEETRVVVDSDAVTLKPPAPVDLRLPARVALLVTTCVLSLAIRMNTVLPSSVAVVAGLTFAPMPVVPRAVRMKLA